MVAGEQPFCPFRQTAHLGRCRTVWKQFDDPIGRGVVVYLESWAGLGKLETGGRGCQYPGWAGYPVHFLVDMAVDNQFGLFVVADGFQKRFMVGYDQGVHPGAVGW